MSLTQFGAVQVPSLTLTIDGGDGLELHVVGRNFDLVPRDQQFWHPSEWLNDVVVQIVERKEEGNALVEVQTHVVFERQNLRAFYELLVPSCLEWLVDSREYISVWAVGEDNMNVHWTSDPTHMNFYISNIGIALTPLQLCDFIKAIYRTADYADLETSPHVKVYNQVLSIVRRKLMKEVG